MSQESESTEARAHLEAPSIEAPARETIRRPAQRASGAAAPAGGGLQSAGLVCACAGIALALLVSFSAGARGALESVGNAQVHSATLIIAGIVLCGLGLQGRRLSGIRRSIEGVGNETLRLDQIAQDGEELRNAVAEVMGVTTELHGNMDTLQKQLWQIAEVAADPNSHASIFRMASSIDKLGTKLEHCINAQTTTLQGNLSGITAESEKASRALASKLSELDGRLAGEHQARQTELQAAFADLRQSSEQAGARAEECLQATQQLASRIDGHQAGVVKGLTSVSAGAEQAARQTQAGLEQLGSRIDQGLEGHSAALGQRLEAVQGSLEQARREQASGIQHLADRLGQELAGQSEKLAREQHELAELASRATQSVQGELERFGSRLEQELRGQQGAFRQALELAADSSSAALRAIEARLDQLGFQLEEKLRDRLASFQATLKQSLESSLASCDPSANLERIGARIEQALTSRRDALTNDLRVVAESASATTTQIQTLLSGLGKPAVEPGSRVQNGLESAVQGATARSAYREAPQPMPGVPAAPGAWAAPGPAEGAPAEPPAPLPSRREPDIQLAPWLDQHDLGEEVGGDFDPSGGHGIPPARFDP